MGSEDLIVAFVVMVAEECVVEGKGCVGSSNAPLRERARFAHDLWEGVAMAGCERWDELRRWWGTSELDAWDIITSDYLDMRQTCVFKI